MKFSDMAPESKHPDYKNYAQHKWLRLVNNDGVEFHYNPSKIPPAFRKGIIGLLESNNQGAMFDVFALAELYNNGIKCIKPTLDQCITLSKIDIKIMLEDFRQPFDTMLVEIPEEYRRYLKATYEVDIAPLYVTSHRAKDFLIGSVSFGLQDRIAGTFITDNVIIEDRIQKDKNEILCYIVGLCQRITYNLMLLATNYGHEDLGYENIKQHRYYVRNKPELAKQDFYYIGLNQKIKIHTTRIEKATSGELIGSPRRPHWRRGYWRQQRYGPAYSLSRPVFIKPVFVKSELFVGSLSDTSVIMQGSN